MERWNPYVSELMLFPNNNTSLCQAKELCWPQGQGPPLSLAGRAGELHADMKLLASEGAEKVWVLPVPRSEGRKRRGPDSVGSELSSATRCHCEGGPAEAGEHRGGRRMAGAGWKHGGNQGSISGVDFSGCYPCVPSLSNWLSSP